MYSRRERALDSLAEGSRNAEEWGFVPSCGAPAVVAIVAAMAQIRSEADTNYLRALLPTARAVLHPEIFDAARSLATDRTASVPARVFGLLVILRQVRPSTSMDSRGWQRLVVGFPEGDCALDYTSDSEFATTFPMPPDHMAAAAAATDSVAADEASPPAVRGVARCIRRTLMSSVPRAIPHSQLQLVHECGRLFRATNLSIWPAYVRYEIVGQTESGDLAIAPGRSSSFLVQTGSEVRLLQHGIEVARIAASGILCPAVTAPPRHLSCTSTDHPGVQDLLHALQLTVSEDESEFVESRQRWGIPVLDTTEVQLVQDAQLCATAYQAYLAQRPSAASDSVAFVARIRQIWAVMALPSAPSSSIPHTPVPRLLLIFNAGFTQVVERIGM